jgi:hypothetical protein
MQHRLNSNTSQKVSTLRDALRYELPPEGQSLLGYIVRRMHKTEWLVPVAGLIAEGDTAQALGRIAMYAIAASTSFGRAFYQPSFNAVGEAVSEPDPTTGAIITAKLEARDPHYQISYTATMPDGGAFSGMEEITGTTIGLKGLGMPAPSRFRFQSGTYMAELTGIITSELALSIFGNTRIRGYGFLHVSDNTGNAGKISVERDGSVRLEVNGQAVSLTQEPPATRGSA